MNFASGKRPRNERKLRKRHRPIDRNFMAHRINLRRINPGVRAETALATESKITTPSVAVLNFNRSTRNMQVARRTEGAPRAVAAVFESRCALSIDSG
jgi:hypothetical protein